MEAIIRPIDPPAAYELVVEQIRRALHMGRYLPGERLPAERELANQLGVSRTTVREAVRVLEGEGLVESRRGARGGLVVLPQQHSDDDLRTIIRSRVAEVEEILDFRLAVEGAAAALAAERRTQADLKRMGTALAAIEDSLQRGAVSQFLRADSEFHMAVARAARNTVLHQAIEDARAVMFLPIGAVFTSLGHSDDLHGKIYAAIGRRDAKAARNAMAAHIESTRAEVRMFLRPRTKPASAAKRRPSGT